LKDNALFRKFEISSTKDVTSLYSIIHKRYLASTQKPSVELREWMTLASFLNKNKSRVFNIIRTTYPFTVVKNERPDFVLMFNNNRNIGIEIVRVTTRNLEALVSLCKQTNSNGWESDYRLYDDSFRLRKDYLKSLLYYPGKELCGSGILGCYQEKRWADVCYKAIKQKSEKNFVIDILLLDDQHMQSSNPKRVIKGLEFLMQKLLLAPIKPKNIKTIASDTQSGMILLYKHRKWLFSYKH